MRALLLSAIFVTASCVGCAEAPAPTQPSVAPQGSLLRSLVPPPATSPTCNDITPKLSMMTDSSYDLSNAFDPTTTVPPNSDRSTVPDYIKADFATVFSNAPSFFKSQPCKRDGIFIIPTGYPHSNAWGFRIFRNNKFERYVAISQNLWPNNTLNLFLKYANDQLQQLFPALAHDPNPPQYDAATPSAGWVTLLAVLAHEYGHVYWSDVLISPAGNVASPRYDLFCPGIFPSVGWTGLPSSPKWRKFADPGTDVPVAIPDDPNDLNPPETGDPSYQDVQISVINDALNNHNPPQYQRARRLMTRLLAVRRPWASIFSAFSVNEDFVETSTLYVLMTANPPLTQLEILIRKKPSIIAVTDIPGDIANRARPLLSGKMICFDDYLRRNLP